MMINTTKATQFVYILPYDKQMVYGINPFGKIIIDKEEAQNLLHEFISKHYVNKVLIKVSIL